jgi:F0F1-type ATP synthase delta subunit
MKTTQLLLLAKEVRRTLAKAGEGPEGLNWMARVVSENPGVPAALENPAIPLEKRLEVFRAALDEGGIRPASRAVLLALLRAYALGVLPALAEELERRELKARGVEPLAVRVAGEAAPGERAAIEKFLQALLGRPVRASYAVDADLLGGFTARSESYFVDASMRGMVHKLTTPEEQ